MIGLKQLYSCSCVINDFNFTELSDKIEELYVEHEEYTEKLATIFLQIIGIDKENAVCARTGGSLQDLGLEYAMHCGLDKTLEFWTVIFFVFKHVKQSTGNEYTLGSTRADVILVRG